jgi:hypothetical protein
MTIRNSMNQDLQKYYPNLVNLEFVVAPISSDPIFQYSLVCGLYTNKDPYQGQNQRKIPFTLRFRWLF